MTAAKTDEKRRHALSMAMIISISTLAAASAGEIVGTWKTQDGDHVELYQCGPALCGKALGDHPVAPGRATTDVKNKDASLRGRPLKGLVFLTGFAGGPSKWSGGQVYNPNDGNTYTGTLTLLPDSTLQLKGCALNILCQT